MGSKSPTIDRTFSPTVGPSNDPSSFPTLHPTGANSISPTSSPSDHPTFYPINNFLSSQPSLEPTTFPTEVPTKHQCADVSKEIWFPKNPKIKYLCSQTEFLNTRDGRQYCDWKQVRERCPATCGNCIKSSVIPSAKILSSVIPTSTATSNPTSSKPKCADVSNKIRFPHRKDKKYHCSQTKKLNGKHGENYCDWKKIKEKCPVTCGMCNTPTLFSSVAPTNMPSTVLSIVPSVVHTNSPSNISSLIPSLFSSGSPSAGPSALLSNTPSTMPTNLPSVIPTSTATSNPTSSKPKCADE